MKFTFRGRKKYFKVSLSNYMFWLLMIEVNDSFDKVAMFWNTYTKEEQEKNLIEYNRLKKILLNKINLE